jgi:dihydroorotate dehydrogenase electron transfer subunit
MKKSIPVTLVSNQEVAPACFRMVLSGQLEDVSFNPGQFLMLRLGGNYDPLLRRPFAAYKLRRGERDCVEIWYKVVGRGTRFMSRMRPNQKLALLGPLGSGFRVSPDTRGALIVAGGMGIVPIRGLIDHLVDSKIEGIHLFTGAKTADHLLFQEKLREMGISAKVATEDGSAGYHGLVTELFAQWLEAHQPTDTDDTICFACGPTPMLQAVAAIAARNRCPCQVSLEARMACGIGVCLGCVVPLHNRHNRNGASGTYGRVCLEGPVFDAGDIVW